MLWRRYCKSGQCSPRCLGKRYSQCEQSVPFIPQVSSLLGPSLSVASSSYPLERSSFGQPCFFCLSKPSPYIGHHPMKPLFHYDMHSGCSSLSAMFTLMVIFLCGIIKYLGDMSYWSRTSGNKLVSRSLGFSFFPLSSARGKARRAWLLAPVTCFPRAVSWSVLFQVQMCSQDLANRYMLFVSVHSPPCAQLWGCDSDWGKTGLGCSDLEEKAEIPSFKMQTEVFDRLQVLHGHQAAGGEVPGAVLLHHDPRHPWTCRKHQICSEVWWGAHGGSYHECQFSRAGSFIIGIRHKSDNSFP